MSLRDPRRSRELPWEPHGQLRGTPHDDSQASTLDGRRLALYPSLRGRSRGLRRSVWQVSDDVLRLPVQRCAGERLDKCAHLFEWLQGRQLECRLAEGSPGHPGSQRSRTSMAHPWRIRSRSHSSAGVRITPLTCRSRSSLFAAVRSGRICKQGVVGSSPIVSTASDQGECSPSDLGKASESRAIEHLSNIQLFPRTFLVRLLAALT